MNYREVPINRVTPPVTTEDTRQAVRRIEMLQDLLFELDWLTRAAQSGNARVFIHCDGLGPQEMNEIPNAKQIINTELGRMLTQVGDLRSAIEPGVRDILERIDS